MTVFFFFFLTWKYRTPKRLNSLAIKCKYCEYSCQLFCEYWVDILNLIWFWWIYWIIVDLLNEWLSPCRTLIITFEADEHKKISEALMICLIFYIAESTAKYSENSQYLFSNFIVSRYAYLLCVFFLLFLVSISIPIQVHSYKLFQVFGLVRVIKDFFCVCVLNCLYSKIWTSAYKIKFYKILDKP